MRWIKPNLRSIYSLLGHAGPPTGPALAFRVEAVRQEMLALLKSVGIDERYPQVFRRIHFADDVHALWYARSDLMTALSSARGEAFAQQKIAAISELFDGLLPDSMRYRQPPRLL